MKFRHLFVALLMLGSASHAQQPASPTPAPVTPTPTNPALPTLKGKLLYKPIGRGAPAGRVDAGSRGDGDEVASLYVLAPEEVGLTTSSQPSLVWFQTAPARLPFEISLLKPNDPKAVLRVRRTDASAGGFQHLDLADHGVRLEPDTDYQWVVALVRDPQSRSRDIVASGWIRHVDKRDALRGSSPARFAAEGIWYDAVAELSKQIAARPRDPQLAADRRDLLMQVGLPPLPTIPKRR